MTEVLFLTHFMDTCVAMSLRCIDLKDGKTEPVGDVPFAEVDSYFGLSKDCTEEGSTCYTGTYWCSKTNGIIYKYTRI